MPSMMGRVMEASILFGLVLVLHTLSLVSAASEGCPTCPVKDSDRAAIGIAFDMFKTSEEMCKELHVSGCRRLMEQNTA